MDYDHKQMQLALWMKFGTSGHVCYEGCTAMLILQSVINSNRFLLLLIYDNLTRSVGFFFDRKVFEA